MLFNLYTSLKDYQDNVKNRDAKERFLLNHQIYGWKIL